MQEFILSLFTLSTIEGSKDDFADCGGDLIFSTAGARSVVVDFAYNEIQR